MKNKLSKIAFTLCTMATITFSAPNDGINYLAPVTAYSAQQVEKIYQTYSGETMSEFIAEYEPEYDSIPTENSLLMYIWVRDLNETINLHPSFITDANDILHDFDVLANGR